MYAALIGLLVLSEDFGHCRVLAAVIIATGGRTAGVVRRPEQIRSSGITRASRAEGQPSLAALSRGIWKYAERRMNRAASISARPTAVMPTSAQFCDAGASWIDL